MEKQIDVIGIGAVNYDYMFFCKRTEYNSSNLPEVGQEYLNVERTAILEDIDKLLYTTEHTYQICGSSLFALRTIHAIDSKLKLSYVGVCGKPTDRELKAGFSVNVHQEFDFLENQDWLFFDEGEPGISLIRMYKGTRNWIDITQGVNSKLESYIRKKEEEEGESFVDFLGRARWIHLSSLADFQQFEFIVKKIREVKLLNPLIKFSVDPGYEYTKVHKKELREVFSIADYVFLNSNEVTNLVGDANLSESTKYNELSAIFNNYGMSNSQVIIIKKPAKHTIASFENGQLLVSNYWHKKLLKRKIINDTGAGDAFAGGFIASMLSSRLVARQPFPIRLGAIAAASRLKCYSNPFTTISNETNAYINKIHKRERNNIEQKVFLTIEDLKKQIPSFIMGIITGIIASLFVWWIQSLVN